jgi:bromodomain-containing factor 1
VANQSIVGQPPENLAESQNTSSVEILTSSQLPDTNTTTSDPPQQSPEAPHTSLPVADAPESEPAPAIESATETVISSALEDTSATSTVPPVVEAQESDLRDTTSPLALATETTLEPQQTIHVEAEPELPIRNMDGAVDAQSVTLDDAMTDLTPLPPFDAPPPADVALSLQDQQPAVNQDAEMIDAPESASFTKVSREREEDTEEEPSAKRTKTENENDIAMAEIPAPELQATTESPAGEAPAAPEVPAATQSEEAAPVKSESTTTITPYETKELIKILKNVVRTTSGKNFRAPVRTLWPDFSDRYYSQISHPVDLATMETNLRDQRYPTLDDFKGEVNLIYENSFTFNGDPHMVTAASKIVRDAIMNKLANIPPEPVAVPKIAKKQRKSTPLSETAPRTSAPRRQSKSGGAAPIAGTAATTFALDPNTSTPLIRRDSTKLEGGRPKREIHPPKNKDLPYNNTSRPKNKKVAQELKFCEEVLAELKKPKHASFASAFMVPVDPVSLNIPNYFSVIKHPMDVSTIEGKVKGGEYQSAKDFERDMKLMFSNCYKFNPAGNVVHQWGKQLEEVFNDAWANKSKWFADHAPAAETPSSNGGSDDEESEEEVEVEEPTAVSSTITVLSERLNEEQEKLIALMTSKKKDPQMLEMQSELVDMIKKKITDAKAKPLSTKKVVKKTKAAKPAKKQAPTKKAAPAATKKSGTARAKYMGTHEKNVISLGISRLPEDIIKEILAMIKSETDVDVSVYECSTLIELTPL